MRKNVRRTCVPVFCLCYNLENSSSYLLVALSFRERSYLPWKQVLCFIFVKSKKRDEKRSTELDSSLFYHFFQNNSRFRRNDKKLRKVLTFSFTIQWYFTKTYFPRYYFATSYRYSIIKFTHVQPMPTEVLTIRSNVHYYFQRTADLHLLENAPIVIVPINRVTEFR